MDIRVNDILTLKKEHPCGGQQFKVLRIGMDFRIECVKCGHRVMLPRKTVEKSVKQIQREG